MSDTTRSPRSTSEQDKPTHTVVVPNSIDMVSVLGPGDEHLRLIERAFEATIHVRGNRMVDMQLSNHKLVERGARMLMDTLHLSEPAARALLARHGSVRAALDAWK